MKLMHLAGAILLVSAVTACSDTPSASKLEQLLQQQVDTLYNELIDIEDVNKLNGWQDNEQHYAAEVSYTIEFKKSFKSYMDEQTAKPGNPLEKMASGMAAGVLKLQYGDFKAGDEYKVSKEILTLRMTEKGWVLAE
jgi:hypothetical protein